MHIVLSKEEKLLIDVLFNDNICNNKLFNSINYEKLIKVSSSHLMLPALYANLKKKKKIELIPKDVKKYLKQIYILNEERNKILIDEALEIKELLKTNNIDFIFLKGTNHLMNRLYDKIGERMIGDIDFLVDKANINEVGNILTKNGYNNSFKYKIWKTKHLPAYRKINNIFKIEPHTEILIYRKRKIFSGKEALMISDKNSVERLLNICVYNYQINDYGYLKASYSYRTIYDFINLQKKIKNYDIKKIKCRYFKRMHITTNILGITNYNIKYDFIDKLFILRLKLKMTKKLYNKFDNIICKIIIKTPVMLMKMIEFIFNLKYRKYAINKLRKKN